MSGCLQVLQPFSLLQPASLKLDLLVVRFHVAVITLLLHTPALASGERRLKGGPGRSLLFIWFPLWRFVRICVAGGLCASFAPVFVPIFKSDSSQSWSRTNWWTAKGEEFGFYLLLCYTLLFILLRLLLHPCSLFHVSPREGKSTNKKRRSVLVQLGNLAQRRGAKPFCHKSFVNHCALWLNWVGRSTVFRKK